MNDKEKPSNKYQHALDELCCHAMYSRYKLSYSKNVKTFYQVGSFVPAF